MDLDSVRMLHRDVGPILSQARGVVEEAAEDRLPLTIQILDVRGMFYLHLLEHVHELLPNISCSLQRPVLQVVLHAPVQGVAGLFPLLVHMQHRHVVAAGLVEILPGIVRMDAFILGAVEDGAVHAKHAADRDHLVHALVLVCLDQGLRLLWIHGKLRHAPAELREVTLVVQRTQRVKLLQGLDQCLWRRRIHEVEMQEVIDTDRLEHQHHVAQVGSLDLRGIVVVQLMLVGPLREESEAFPRLDPASAARSLVGRGLRAGHDDQGLHACPWVEGVLLAKARVDHKDDVVNSDGGFGDVRSQDDFSRAIWRLFEDLCLHIRGQVGVDRKNQKLPHRSSHPSCLEAQQVHGLLDLLLSCEEDEHITRPLRQVNLEHCDDTGVQIVGFRCLRVVDTHGIAPAGDVEDRRIVEVLGELLGIQRG
mmetsp:Transcript_55137/g.129443  ORF Transcript_55137/g.129443 Transcript_55137/m.129443 type:complete len:421 (+) Transcript_55137:277-1539(+)